MGENAAASLPKSLRVCSGSAFAAGRANCGKRAGMKQCAFRIGLSAVALWSCTLPAAPAEGVRVAQAAQNPPPARAPRLPTTGQVTPAPAIPAGENARVQNAPQTNAGQAAPAPPQVPTRT